MPGTIERGDNINKITKVLLVVLGSIFLGVGILGIFLPLLPTTPFLLLSAACYSRSSEKIYNKLLGSKLLGKYIKNYREGKGISISVKAASITLLWLAIGYAAIVAAHSPILKLILVLIALGVTLHILRIKTAR